MSSYDVARAREMIEPGTTHHEQLVQKLKDYRLRLTLNFDLSMEDYTIILNALHYYKKVDKHTNFQQYNEERIKSTT